MEYSISAYAHSNVGKRRTNNEDNFYLAHKKVNSLNDAVAFVNEAPALIASVCDGMGGEESGEVASGLAVDTVEEFEAELLNSRCSREAIWTTVDKANEKICAQMSVQKKRMGTTLTLLGVFGDNFVAVNIGDSRIYRYSAGGLTQISRDHTQAQSMVDSGMISKEQAMNISQKHMLTQHLGIFKSEMIIEPYVVRAPMSVGDRFLLCSDGLTDMVSEEEIKAVFDSALSIRDTAETLVNTALKNGGRDNVTVLVCEAEEKINEPTAEMPSAIKAKKAEFTPPAVSKQQENTRKKKYKISNKALVAIIVISLIATLVSSVYIIKNKNKGEKSATSVSQSTVSRTEEKSTAPSLTTAEENEENNGVPVGGIRENNN